MEFVRILKSCDTPAARALWQARFHDPEPFTDWYFAKRFLPDWSAGLFEGDMLVSMIHGCPMRLFVRGRVVDALAISGVSTKEGYEKRGYMHAVMRFILQLARKRACPLAFFKPEDFGVYRSLGQLPCTRVKWGVGTGRLAPDFEKEADETALLACYRTATTRYSGAVDRNRREFADRMADYASCGGRVIAERCDGKTAGYAVLLDDGSCPEALAVDGETYGKLLDRLPAGTQVKLPPDAPCGGEITDGNIVVAADVQTLIKTFVRGRDIAFSVTDPAVLQNNGVFNALGEDAPNAESVSLTAGALTQAIVGYAVPDELKDIFDGACCYCVEEY